MSNWAPDLDQFFFDGETPEARRSALRAFILIAQEGDVIPPQLLAFVADGVSRYLEGAHDPWASPRGRPAARQTDWNTWAAWFALYCDPQFAHLPLSTVPGNRYEAVIERLRLPIGSERQAQKLVNVFEEGKWPHFIVLDSYWTQYARLFDWAETKDTYQRMAGWAPQKT